MKGLGEEARADEVLLGLSDLASGADRWEENLLYLALPLLTLLTYTNPSCTIQYKTSHS